MQTAGMIEVTSADLAALVRAAYAPSRQQGLGVFDANGRSGGLSDETVNDILSRPGGHVAFSMDYVNGRSCKFTVFQHGERRFIANRWYDHSDRELRSLLEQVGLSPDLVQTARDEEAAHRARVKDAAIAFLNEHGGTFRENRGLRTLPTDDEKVPEAIGSGLFYAKYDGLVSETYESSGHTIWKLV